MTSGVPGWLGEGLCGGLSLLGSVAVFRLLTDPLPGSLGALLASAAVGFASGFWIVRSRRSAVAVLLSALVLLAVIIEAAVPETWHHLLVDPDTWHRVATALHVTSNRTLLAACLLVSVTGAAERVAFGYRARPEVTARPGLAVLPTLALVTWSIAASPGVVAGVLGAGIIVIGGTAIVVGDLEGQEPGVGRGRGDNRGREWQRRILIVLVPPLAVFGTIFVAVSGSGALGTNSSGSLDSSSTPTAEALVANVIGFAEHDPDVVLFRARSALPTYWQVAILTRQVGDTWEVSSSLARAIAGHGAPPPGDKATLTSGTGAQSPLVAQVTIASYRGLVLPVPIGTTNVEAPSTTRLVDGAIVQARQTKPGDRYVATATVSPVGEQSLTASSAGLGAAAGSPGPATLSSASIPPEVRTIARQVVAGADGQSAMVQQLVNWFRSGRFRYATAAQPAPPPGMAPVVAFLTRTKTGNCQTFTDAFALMAQSLGIRVRVAVGFTSGTWSAGGETTVTGADAHTWPEVYLSSAIGWESVEPTPASNIAAIAPVGVLGLGGVSTPTTPTTLPNPTPSVVPNPTNLTAPSSVSPSPTATTPSASPRLRPVLGPNHSVPVLRLVLGGGLLVAVAVAVVLLVVRRRKMQTSREPYQAVVEAWQRCERSLAKVGLGCPPSRTHVDHARRLRAASAGAGRVNLDRSEVLQPDLEQLVDDVEMVALIEREARYGGRPVGEDAAGRAGAAADRVRHALWHHRLRRAARGLLAAPIAPGGGAHGTDERARSSSRYGADEAEGAFSGAERAGV